MQQPSLNNSFSQVFHANPAAMMIFHAETQLILEVNHRFCELTGLPREALFGHPIGGLEFVTAEDQEENLGLERTAKNLELKLSPKEGVIRYILYSSEELVLEVGPCILGIFHDITEYKRAEAQLQLVVESVPNAILLVNQSGNIVMNNSVAENFFLYSASELTGMNVDQLVPERFRKFHAIHRGHFLSHPSARAMGVGRDLYGIRKDGSEFPIEIGLTPVETRDGLLVMATIVDITGRKQVEEQDRAQAARLKILADVSQAFSAVGQDYTLVLEQVVRQVADLLGSSCAIRLFSENGAELEMVAMYDSDPETPELTKGLMDHIPLQADDTLLTRRILESDQAFVLPGMSEAQLREIFPSEHWPSLKHLTSQTRLIAPMRVNGQAMGFLILARKQGAPPFEEVDLMLAQDLSDRATLAISNARLFTQLQASEELFRSAFQNSPVGICLTTLDGYLQNVNWALARMLDYPQEELEGKHFNDITHPDDLEIGKEAIEKMVNGLEQSVLLEKRYLQKHGQIVWTLVSSFLLRDVRGRPLHFITQIFDISERKRAEIALQESEARYHRVLDAMMEGCQIIDFNWRYIYVNEVVAHQGKYRAEDLLNHTMMEVYPGIEETDLFQSLRQCMEQRIPRRLENQFVFPDGSLGWFELSIQPAREGIFILSTDITERKRAEDALHTKNEELKNMSQQLWQTAKLATMGELAASVAHELNNPLATVSLRTEMLLGQSTPDDPATRSLQIIEMELKRMSTLVANLLAFSRRSTSQVSTIDIREDLSKTLELVQFHLRKQNIQVIHQFSPKTPWLQADRQQMRQVFLNLITNAADAMPHGGTLTLRTWTSEENGDTAPLTPHPLPSLGLPISRMAKVFIEIADTGMGITPEQLARVWEPFYTTKSEGKGTGLGLAICRRIIQEHGGTIEIFSEGVPGKGTTVLIILPTVKER